MNRTNKKNIVPAKYNGVKVVVEKLNGGELGYKELKDGDSFVYLKGNRIMKPKFGGGKEITNFDSFGRLIHRYDTNDDFENNVVLKYNNYSATYLGMLTQHYNFEIVGKSLKDDDVLIAKLGYLGAKVFVKKVGWNDLKIGDGYILTHKDKFQAHRKINTDVWLVVERVASIAQAEVYDAVKTFTEASHKVREMENIVMRYSNQKNT